MDNNDIKNFLRNQPQSEPESPKQADFEKGATNAIKHFSGMNEQQLMSEMFRVAAGERDNGSLDAEKLEDFYKKASPMMSQQQRNKLRALINQLKY